jgi:hypothetical protein
VQVQAQVRRRDFHQKTFFIVGQQAC